MKKNCWEFFKCGREKAGKRVKDLSVCPAVVETRLHGIHGGVNGGRSCWVVPGTCCEKSLPPGSNHNVKLCTACDFYKLVRKQEKDGFVFSGALLTNLINEHQRHTFPNDPSR